jgi:hypothetical protein
VSGEGERAQAPSLQKLGVQEGYWFHRLKQELGCPALEVVYFPVPHFLSFILFIYIFIYLFIIHLFTCMYIVWVISPPCPLPSPSPPLPHLLSGRTCSAPIFNFVEEKA